jgi:AcrR family transcriptional regulator
MSNEEIRERNLEHVLEVAHDLFLEYGIEAVTKEMISRQCGLSRRTLDRYFVDKKDCVIRTMEYYMVGIRKGIMSRYTDEMFAGDTYTGADLLRMYMMDVKEVFLRDPRHFVLYSEYKLYVYRNCEDYEQSYSMLCNWLGSRGLRQRIYAKGRQDGSMPTNLDLYIEEEYFSESFFGFLANLALSMEQHSLEEMETQIDKRIDNTLLLYHQGGLSAIAMVG